MRGDVLATTLHSQHLSPYRANFHPTMPSGKQILLRVLTELSQGTSPPPTGEEITDRVKAGFLLHGSTADESWPAVERLEWSEGRDKHGEVYRHGITYEGIFLSDLLEDLITPDEIPAHLAEKYPELSPEGYQEAMGFIWLILSSVQWFSELGSVEEDSDNKVTGEKLLASCMRMLRHYRLPPEDFV
jgi:hypothetical protein